MLRPLERRFQRGSAWSAVGAGALLTALVFLLDLTTGAELAFSLFYVLPVAFLMWFVGAPAAILAGLAGAGLSLVLDLRSDVVFSHAIVPYWNALASVGLYLATIALLRALKRALTEEKELARTDALTGVANPRRFFEAAEMELSRSARYGHPFTVVYVDIDDFKAFNDRLGHVGGDDTLRSVAGAITETARHSDLVARLGGDEFGVLLPETPALGGERFLLRLRKSLDRRFQSERGGVTASVGAVTFVDAPDSIEEMISAADALMYEVKRAGKNGMRQRVLGGAISLELSGEELSETSVI